MVIYAWISAHVDFTNVLKNLTKEALELYFLFPLLSSSFNDYRETSKCNLISYDLFCTLSSHSKRQHSHSVNMTAQSFSWIGNWKKLEDTLNCVTDPHKLNEKPWRLPFCRRHWPWPWPWRLISKQGDYWVLQNSYDHQFSPRFCCTAARVSSPAISMVNNDPW